MSSIWNWLFGGIRDAQGTPKIEPPGPYANASVPSVRKSAAARPLSPETAEELRGFMRREIAAGYADKDAILDSAVDYLVDEADEDSLREAAANLWPDLVAEHRAMQADWPEVTDYDRLTAAFAALGERGIVAREHFTCCNTCGAAEIWDEIEEVKDGGGTPRGYAFFHWQDTERAVEGGGVYLNYGACEEGEGAALGIAQEIVEELEAHDLPTDWDGSWNHKIGVPLDWKRRQDFAA